MALIDRFRHERGRVMASRLRVYLKPPVLLPICEGRPMSRGRDMADSVTGEKSTARSARCGVHVVMVGLIVRKVFCFLSSSVEPAHSHEETRLLIFPSILETATKTPSEACLACPSAILRPLLSPFSFFFDVVPCPC